MCNFGQRRSTPAGDRNGEYEERPQRLALDFVFAKFRHDLLSRSLAKVRSLEDLFNPSGGLLLRHLGRF